MATYLLHPSTSRARGSCLHSYQDIIETEQKERFSKGITGFVLIMADCVGRGGSRRGRGLGFGRQGWLVFRGWCQPPSFTYKDH